MLGPHRARWTGRYIGGWGPACQVNAERLWGVRWEADYRGPEQSAGQHPGTKKLGRYVFIFKGKDTPTSLGTLWPQSSG